MYLLAMQKLDNLFMNMATNEGPRRILICVSGISPAVITETLYALVKQDKPFIPDEIHVVTTLTGKVKVQADLLDPTSGNFHSFMHDYLPGKTIRFDADTVHVIGQRRKIKAASNPWGGLMQGVDGKPELEEVELQDITTDGENKAAADTIYRVMRELKAVPNTVLHASVAGGRKSMSFYMGHAFSLLADLDDKLSHVLVNAPFEKPELNFYYPPLTPATLNWIERSGEKSSICTDAADIKLAELSVLKLGALMGNEWPVKAQNSFEFAVRLAQATLVVPEVRVNLNGQGAYLEVCDERVDLPPQQFAVFALHALARKHEDDLPNGAALVLENLSHNIWGKMNENLGGRLSAAAVNFSPIRAKIHEALVNAVGPVAKHFKIEADKSQKKATGITRSIFLKTPPDRIILSGDILKKTWWNLLNKELT
jgi:CRISPR-associated protein (TIGR02584 family)